MSSLLAHILAEELCYRIPAIELTRERMQEFDTLTASYLAEQTDIPEDIDMACEQLLPGLIALAGVSERSTECLYPTFLYQDP